MRKKLPILIITVGLPRSGKSTWARKQNFPIVCPDDIRKSMYDLRFIPKMEPMIWFTAKIMVNSLFASGHKKVILDSCMYKKEHRELWVSKHYKIQFKIFSVSEKECIRRAKLLNDDIIIPIIQKMASQFEGLK